jgi:hypothetical protein
LATIKAAIVAAIAAIVAFVTIREPNSSEKKEMAVAAPTG